MLDAAFQMLNQVVVGVVVVVGRIVVIVVLSGCCCVMPWLLLMELPEGLLLQDVSVAFLEACRC